MEPVSGSRRLVSGMLEEGCCGCCCGGEAGSHRQRALMQLLRNRETRLRRLAQFLAAALLTAVAAAALAAVLLGQRARPPPPPPPAQPTVQPVSHASGNSFKQQQLTDDKNPSAMLTAPNGNNNDGTYLNWESEDGNAFCQGGFNYSSGNLVVPRNGIYSVSLQITYEGNKNDCKNDGELTLTNEVFVFRDSYKMNMPLLSSFDTVSCRMKQWKKSLHTAGTFLLEANCRLRVTSSHRDLIVKDETQVFFSAVLLPK